MSYLIWREGEKGTMPGRDRGGGAGGGAGAGGGGGGAGDAIHTTTITGFHHRPLSIINLFMNRLHKEVMRFGR